VNHRAIRRATSLAEIDPEGRVVATWRTWFLIGGAIVWLTMTYVKLDAVVTLAGQTATDQQVTREALIKAGILSPVARHP